MIEDAFWIMPGMASRLSNFSFAAHLSPRSLQALERCVAEYRFDEGDVAYFPDEIVEGPLWVVEGCLVVESPGTPALYRGVGETFGASSWWTNSNAGAFVKGKTPGRYLAFLRSSLLEWARSYPEESHALNQVFDDAYALEIDSWKSIVRPVAATVRRFPHLMESEETPVAHFRKSTVQLTLSILLPSLLALASLAYGAFVQRVVLEDFVRTGVWILVSIVEIVSLTWIAFVVGQWVASIVVVTDRSILMKELDWGKRRSYFHKIPLEKVREVVFQKSNWFHSLFRLVDLDVSSDGHSSRIVFPLLDEDATFLETFRHLKERRVQALSDKASIREKLASRFGYARRPRRTEDFVSTVSKKKSTQLSWRYEKNGIVSFRRHSWHWWKKAFRQFAVLALGAFVTALAVAAAPSWSFAIACLAAAFATYPVARLVWDWVDWTNDRLMIDGTKIVALHRKPLWLGEVRQEGELTAIQHVGIRKETIGALVMDFGDVVVSLGTERDLIFECASHPQAVQEEIFQRRRSVEARTRDENAGRRVEEVADILRTYEEAQEHGFFKKDPT